MTLSFEDKFTLKNTDKPNLPPNLYAFIDVDGRRSQGMSKAEASELVDHYNSSGTVMDDHNEHTPPIKNACYFIRYKPQDVRARRNTDGNDYEDNTGGKINKKGDIILKHQYCFKLAPRHKSQKFQDKKRNKDIYTFKEPINLQIIHYRGNWPLEDTLDASVIPDATVDMDNSGNSV